MITVTGKMHTLQLLFDYREQGRYFVLD